MVTFRTSTSETVAAWTARRRDVAEMAVKAGVGAATRGMQLELRQGIYGSSVNPKVANFIGAAVYPKGARGSLGAAGSVYARGASADRILSALSEGLVILPKTGRFLAIPTGYNRASGRRAGQPLVTVKSMLRNRKLTFVLKTPSGLLWCIRVTEAQTKTRSGRRKRLPFAGGIDVGQMLGSGRSGRVRPILDRGYVPMFHLVRQVQLPKALDPARTARRWADQIPGLIDRALPAGI